MPATLKNRAEYDKDFYSWANEQAGLLESGRLDALDTVNLAEEVRSLGNEQYYKLQSAYRVLIMHMLKWNAQPRKRTRSWGLSILEQRATAEDVLQDNPGLKPRREEAIARAYKLARLAASRETGLSLKRFQQDCPYSLDDIMTRDFPWPSGS